MYGGDKWFMDTSDPISDAFDKAARASIAEGAKKGMPSPRQKRATNGEGPSSTRVRVEDLMANKQRGMVDTNPDAYGDTEEEVR